MPNFRSTRQTLAALLLATAGMIISNSFPAQAQQQDRQFTFDSPAQPLDAALADYFRVTGVQLLYDSTITAGRRSSAVRGIHSSRDALRLLLAGTGLIARSSRSNAAIITKAGSVGNGSLVPLGRVLVRERVLGGLSPRERFKTYYLILESELRSHLRRDRRTARLSFEVRAQIRIGRDGRVSQVSLDPGGNRDIGKKIALALQGRDVTAAPANLQQPLEVILRARR